MKISMTIIALLLTCGVFAQETPEKRIEKMGIKLSRPSAPIGSYKHFIQVGDMLYLTGKGPALPEGGYMQGKVGKDLTIEEGKEASRLSIIHQLGVLKEALGDLSRVVKIIKLQASVNSTDDFTQHPKVVDGASDLLINVFGENIGSHARVVYGSNSLPMNIPVEIDLVIQIKDPSRYRGCYSQWC